MHPCMGASRGSAECAAFAPRVQGETGAPVGPAATRITRRDRQRWRVTAARVAHRRFASSRPRGSARSQEALGRRSSAHGGTPRGPIRRLPPCGLSEMTNLSRLQPPLGPLGKRLKFGPGPPNSLGQRREVGRANRLPLRCGLRQNAQFLDGRGEQRKSIGRQHRGEHVLNVSIIRVLAHRHPVEQIARGQCPTPVEEFSSQ